jgi:hypothetical protein
MTNPCASLLEPDTRLHPVARLGAHDLELAPLVVIPLPSPISLDLARSAGCRFRDPDLPCVFVQELEDDCLRFERPRVTREVARVQAPFLGERGRRASWERDEFSSFLK